MKKHEIIKKDIFHFFVYNLNKMIKKILIKIGKYVLDKIFSDDKQSHINFQNNNIIKNDIDFFNDKKVIFIKDDTNVELVDIENYVTYYKKGLVAKILYRKKKINIILLSYNGKHNNNLYYIYKASLEFHFFLTKSVTSKNHIFVQYSFIGKDNEDKKFVYFSKKIILIKNVDLEFDILFNLMKESIIDKYNFKIDIHTIELYTYFVYNDTDDDQKKEINTTMNKYYYNKKDISTKKLIKPISNVE